MLPQANEMTRTTVSNFGELAQIGPFFGLNSIWEISRSFMRCGGQIPMYRIIGKAHAFVALALMLTTLTATEAVAGVPAAAGSAPTQNATNAARTAYRLDTGDKVQVIVYGEDDLSGQFDVDGSGNVRLPLIGQVHVAGLTLRQFEQAVAAKLANGYLLNPKVSAEIATYRPFTILGEVNKPGEYPYESGMNVLNAVALGGGYTYRADEDDVYIRRKGASAEVELPATASTAVFPGDTVRVDERIF